MSKLCQLHLCACFCSIFFKNPTCSWSSNPFLPSPFEFLPKFESSNRFMSFKTSVFFTKVFKFSKKILLFICFNGSNTNLTCWYSVPSFLPRVREHLQRCSRDCGVQYPCPLVWEWPSYQVPHPRSMLQGRYAQRLAYYLKAKLVNQLVFHKGDYQDWNSIRPQQKWPTSTYWWSILREFLGSNSPLVGLLIPSPRAHQGFCHVVL